MSVDRNPRRPVIPQKTRDPVRGDEVAILPSNRAFRKAMSDMRRLGSNDSLLPQFGGSSGGGSNPQVRFDPRKHAVNR